MDPTAPIAPQCKSEAPVALILREKFFSLTGDSATIKDAEKGNKVFECNAHLLTISQRRTLVDAHGKDVGQLRLKKTPGLHPACYVGTMEDEKRCMVKLKGILNPLKCDADIYLGNTVIGECSGDWRAKSISIRLGGKEVATVKRKRTIASTLMDADSYCIEIVEGIDQAFMVLITLAFDELYHDKEGQSGGPVKTMLGL